MKIMKKYCIDLTVCAVERVNERHVLLRLTAEETLPPMLPGQFAEVRVDGSATTFLRRPISIHFVDEERNELWLLVAMVGDGTRRLAELKVGEKLNCVLPLGRGFSLPTSAKQRFLLVGGGVGVAPLLLLAKEIGRMGGEATFLLGARTESDLLELELYNRYGRVRVTTEDGTAGVRGMVTDHPVLSEPFDRMSVCGPLPMMKAVAAVARRKGTPCEVSLENMMACGVGACLCCVEKTTKGNVCVCTDGPVFNTENIWLT